MIELSTPHPTTEPPRRKGPGTLGTLALSATLGAIALTLGIANPATAQLGNTPARRTLEELTSSVLTESPLTETTALENATEETQTEEQVVSQAEANTANTNNSGAIAPPAAPTPAPTPFSPVITGITDVSAGSDTIQGIGHLRPSDIAALGDDNVDWLKSTILPLYASPGGEHWGWIYEGWLIPKGHTYLAIGRDAGFTMVRAYDNLHTFPVLESREDGWFRVQYTENGSAWAHTSQLNLGDTALTVEPWEDRLAAEESVQFLDSSKAQPLRSQPEAANNMLSLIPADSLIEPTVFQGDWMLVRVTRPIADCEPLTGATVTEGWMRWRSEEGKALAWHTADNSCSQEVSQSASQ
ncbi:MAG: hypothetical protein AAFP03_05730 [Cyanobacteria bacterium J06598_3]